jgi:uncharacterized protein HemY
MLLPHSIKVLSFYMESYDKSRLDRARIATHTAWCLMTRGEYGKAEQMRRSAAVGREEVLGREKPDTLITVNNLGMVLESQGKYEEAEAMHRRALEGRKKMLGREHHDTLTSVRNLGSVLWSQG